MKVKASKPVVVAVVLIIVSLLLAGSGFYLFQREQSKVSNLLAQLEDLKARHRIAQSKYQQSQGTISELQSKLDTTKSQFERLTIQAQEERAAREEALNRLNEQLEAQKELRTDLEAVLKQTDEELNRIKAQVKKLQSEKEAMQTRMKELGLPFPGVELGRIIVSPEGVEATTIVEGELPAAGKRSSVSGLEGKVLVVNKDYNFIVVNLGSKDGLNMGDTFSVFHDDNYIGDVKVEKLHDSMAAAGFLSSGIKGKVSEGDKVVQKNK